MSKKIRLPNGRYIKVKTDNLELAKSKAKEYYKSGNEGFIDAKTNQLAKSYDTNFDYDTGVDALWLRTKLGAQETLHGKETILKEAVGSNGFTIDSSGNLALTPLGLERMGINPNSNKNVVIDESGFSAGDFADFSGTYGPIVGSIAGSILTRGKIKPKFPGIKSKTLIDLGKISLGTGTGAVAGKTAEESLEYVSGLQDNTPAELAELAAQEFAIGAGGEFVFGLGGKLLKSAFGQNALIRGKLGAQDLKRASALARGVFDPQTGKTYKGSIALAALDSPIAGRLQPILEEISGSKSRKRGLTDALITTLKNTYRATNDLTEEFSKNVDQIKTTGFGDAGGDVVAGKSIRDALEKQQMAAEKALTVAEDKLKQSVDSILNNMDSFGQPATTDTGFAIREFTEQAYNSWKTTSDDLYKQVNKFFEVEVPLEEALKNNPAFKDFSQAQLKNLAKTMPGGKGTLTKQLEWIDSSPINAYAKHLDETLVGKGVDEADEIRKSLQYLKMLGGKNRLVSLENLLNIRSDLASKARQSAEGVNYAKLSDLERTQFLDSIDRIIKNLSDGSQYAVKQYNKGGGNKITSKKVKNIMKSVGVANSYFARGIQAFDRPVFKKLLLDAQSGGLDTDKILTKVLTKNNGEQLKRYLDTLDFQTAGIRKQYDEVGKVLRSQAPDRLPFLKEGAEDILAKADIKIDETVFQSKEQVRNMLQREFIRNIVKNINKTGNMNYTKLANTIDSYGTTADELFGGSGAKKDFLTTLRETDNLLNVGTLDEFEKIITEKNSAKGIADALKDKIIAQTNLQDIEKLEVFKRIQQGTVDPEEIVAKIFKPAGSEDIARVKQLLGPESVEFKQFQQSAMRGILDNVVNPGEDAITKLFNENGFVKSLDKYGSEVLKETFGDEQAKLLLKAKDTLKFSIAGEKAAGGGTLATQGLLMRFIFAPLQAVGVFTPLRVIAWAMGRPNFLKWLAGETTNKEFVKQIPSLIDSYGIAFPAAKVAASQLGVRELSEGYEEGQRFLETDGIDPRAPLSSGGNLLQNTQTSNLNLNIPDVQPIASVPTQAPISRSLLGGSIANEDIAARMNVNRGGLVSKRSAIDQEIAELMARV